jgi:hypothetical protein
MKGWGFGATSCTLLPWPHFIAGIDADLLWQRHAQDHMQNENIMFIRT